MERAELNEHKMAGESGGSVEAAAAGGSMALMWSEGQWGTASEAETELTGGSGAE